MRHSLHIHPRSSAPAVALLTAEATRTASGLTLHFALSGDIGRIALPAPAPSARRDNLWQHTCFEAFIGTAGNPAYREFNLSPSGQWAAYDFSAYRTNGKDAPLITPPVLHVHATKSLLELSARIEWPDAPSSAWKLGLTAVVEETAGNKTYWALFHPNDRPDFHHAGGFVLDVPEH